MSNKSCCFAFLLKQCCCCKVIQIQLFCWVLKQVFIIFIFSLYLQQFHYPLSLNVDEWLHLDVCAQPEVSQNAFRTNQRPLMAEEKTCIIFKILLLLCHEMLRVFQARM